MSPRPAFLCLSALSLSVLSACQSGAPEPKPVPTTEASSKTTARFSPSGGPRRALGDGGTPGARPQPPKRKVAAKPAASVEPSKDDPLAGKWSLDDATKGLPKGNTLFATLETDLGNIECKLFDDKAPITVANFVGLARGTRPWKTPEGKWETKPAYDGTIFHRIIKGFMIQGGDAKKNGTGEAGFVIPDEQWEDANHDRAGLLCMANRGPNTNSAQFFITDDAALHLDPWERQPTAYTIFGECTPLDVVHSIAAVEVRGERPNTPPVIKKVSITRKDVKGGDAPAASASASAGPAASASAKPAASAGAKPTAGASAGAAPKAAPVHKPD